MKWCSGVLVRYRAEAGGGRCRPRVNGHASPKPDLRQVSHFFVVQFVQALQVTDCGYLQEIEIEIAGITKVGEITMEGGTPVIVLADTAVE